MNLKPEIMNKARLLLTGAILMNLSTVMAAPSWIDIREASIAADGGTVVSEKIQELIDELSADGGGTLYFPPGAYICGTIELRDNITLYLENNAAILGSADMADYKPRGLIIADGAENIALLGQGEINGRNHFWWVDQREIWTEEEYVNHRRRMWSWVPHFVNKHASPAPGRAIRFSGCRNVTIRDVTIKDSESWNLHILGCRDVTIDGIRLISDLTGPNSDGIDIESSQDVTISNCEVYCGDDAICLKNRHEDYNHLPCKNITVTNCIVTTTCNALKLGTGTHGDFENITFSNCVLKAALPDEPEARKAAETLHPDAFDNGLAPLSGIALESVDGGHVKGITISNIVMHGVRTPIFLRLGNRGGRDEQKTEDPVPGSLGMINISNVIAYDAVNASSIMGIPGHPVRNVTLNNISIFTDGSGTAEMADRKVPERIAGYPEAAHFGRMPVYGVYIRHAEGIHLNNWEVHADAPDQRPLMICEDVENLTVNRLFSSSNTDPGQLIRLIDVRHASLTGSYNQTGAEVWVGIEGGATTHINIQDLFPSMGQRIVTGTGVKEGTVRFE